MPKLLQRNILRNSFISLISSLIAVVCWSFFMVSGYVYIYTLNLFLLVICKPEIATSGLNVFVLPDYMYIAPYTKEQRKELIRKAQRYKFFAVYVWLIIIFVLPFGCIEYMRGNTSALIVCLSEVILSASFLYSNIFSLYIVKRSVCSFWLTFGIKLAMVVSFMMAADKTAGTESVNVIIVLLVIVSSVILILVCRIKYQERMFSSMADYEYVKEKLPVYSWNTSGR